MEEPNKSEIKRNPDGTIAEGSGPLNPKGRPKGKTLKEFAREMLMTMDDEEKREYMSTLPREIVWKMAEGNPANATDLTSGGMPILSEEQKQKANEAIKHLVGTGDTE